MKKKQIKKSTPWYKKIWEWVLSIVIMVVLVAGAITLGAKIGGSVHNDDIMFNRNGYECTWGEFKEIRAAGYEGLKEKAVKECSKKKNVKITPIALLRPFALAHVEPDMKNCITDEGWMILEKKDGKWTLLLIGTDPGITVPFFKEPRTKLGL